jgi:3-oxoadipate enol-lactonase
MRATCSAPAHLFGISYGAMVATWLAIDSGALVDRLVLASCAARGRDAITAEPGEKLALLARAIGRGSPRVALAEAVASDASRRSPSKTAQLEHAIEESPRDDAELVWLAAAVATHDASAELGSIRAPTLVLTGESDELIPSPLQDALAAAIAGATHETIASAGHAITIDRPDACAHAVLAFVRRPRPRSR